ncbi:uncharacterized protein LOC117173945 [Belonocnema kinseyi]|uniref:uncharacterized protein LOC117173945 n=1 Tax=Belonocnema kinseyi TaxID=2817044 RepID=UPI00143D1962|nr:uncharacterized protein LOC117173945 [Belonocnema kinseyi]
MKRNPQFSLRTPEGCSLARAIAFNRHNVEIFYNLLEEVLVRGQGFLQGTRIYNLDETSTTTNAKTQRKVIAERGVKQVSSVTSGEKGTTCVIIAGDGNCLPPAMVLPRKKFKSCMLNQAPPGTLGLATPSGWMNCELVVETMKHFIKFSGSSIDNPSL